MKNKKVIFAILVIIIAVAAGYMYFTKNKKAVEPVVKEIKPSIEDIIVSIAAIGVVEPQNRIEIKPSVAGRMESILVVEGQYVQAGQTLALMSSTERAALIDAARSKGAEVLKTWEDAYKPIAIISPITGEIIARNIEPGQTVSQADPVLVISDRLIVKAQVDETDIGKVKLGQDVTIKLDAYPEQSIAGRIAHISYESTIVNNVTIYQVDIIPQTVPGFFRSGMSANVNIILASRLQVLTIPSDVIINKKDSQFVHVKRESQPPAMTRITTGLSAELKTEVVSGITIDDVLLQRVQNYSLTDATKKSNPMMMRRPGAH